MGGVNDDEHLRNLEAVFQQFQKYGLRVELRNCVFMAPSVTYFGLCFSARGTQPTDEKVKAIREAPTPCNVTELRVHTFFCSSTLRTVGQQTMEVDVKL